MRLLLARLPQPPFSRTVDKDLRDKELGYDDIHPENCKNPTLAQTEARSDYPTIVNDFVECLPQFAKLLDSDDSFRIVRRFGTPAVRILLRKQIEIHELAKELYQLDASDEASENLRYRVRSVHEFEGSDFEKSKLMDKLEIKISTYCEKKIMNRVKRFRKLTLLANR